MFGAPLLLAFAASDKWSPVIERHAEAMNLITGRGGNCSRRRDNAAAPFIDRCAHLNKLTSTGYGNTKKTKTF